MQKWQQEYQKVVMDAQKVQAEAAKHLDLYLDEGNATHQGFKQQIQSFAYYLRPEKYNSIYGGGWGMQQELYNYEWDEQGSGVVKNPAFIKPAEEQVLEMDVQRAALEEEAIKKEMELREAQPK
jgi:hypothetical protein